MKEILSIIVLLLVADTLATFYGPFNGHHGHSGAKPFVSPFARHVPNPFPRPGPPLPHRNYWEPQRHQSFYENPPPLNQYSHEIKADEGTWLCQNTKTGDLIVFSRNEGCKAECQATAIPQSLPTQSTGPSPQNNHNIPTETVIVHGETSGDPNKPNDRATTENATHHGEGLIDVRFGGLED